jgi:hypothetical protein
MQTMQPVVLRGLTGLALRLEEFGERADSVRRELIRRGLDALLVHGDARHYAPLAWVTGFVPMLRWAVAVVAAEGDVELYLAMPGTRDLPAMRKLAAVGVVDGIAALEGSLQRFRHVALAGARHMRARQEVAIRAHAAVSGDGDALLAGLTDQLSAGELALLEAVAAIAAAAAQKVEEAWHHGAAAGRALLTGDLSAREHGAHDVRLLWSPDGGRSFMPLTAPVSDRPDPFAFYLAVEVGGYWGEAFRTLGAATDDPVAPHPTVAPAARMWLSIEETADEPRRPGVYSIRTASVTGAVTSRTVRVP